EHETTEIAERILKETRPLREIGIILRTREPYASILETTLARYGIPARFYFADPLSTHPLIAHLSGIIRAMLAGWDQELLLSALRMPVSGLGATPEGDRLDFDWRARLPAYGLPGGDHPIFSHLAEIDSLRKETLQPPQWSDQLWRTIQREAPAL